MLYAWPWTNTTPGGVVLKLSEIDLKPGAEKAMKEGSSPLLAPPCAATGTVMKDASLASTISIMNVLAAEAKSMVLKNALKLRRKQPLTPYKVKAWNSMLLHYNLLVKYPTVVHSLCNGFDAGIWPIHLNFTLPNSPILLLHPEAYHEMVSATFSTSSQMLWPALHANLTVQASWSTMSSVIRRTF